MLPESLFLVSIVAGFVGAMSGMGGGVVLIPALTLLGMPIKQAIAVSIVSVVATSSGAASAYVRDRLTNLKVGMFLEMFTITGALLGASLTLIVPEQPLYVAFGVVVLATWSTLLFRRTERLPDAAEQDRLTRWLAADDTYVDAASGRTIHYYPVRAYLGGPLMVGAGLIAGLLGVGAGSIKVLIFDVAMGLPAKVATTTSNLIIGVTALAGTSVYLAAGLIDPGLAAPVILGVLLGALVGTRLLVRLRNQVIRRFFLVVLLVLGLEMVVRGVLGGL
jgi:uncharacterized membrane protein YfcA